MLLWLGRTALFLASWSFSLSPSIETSSWVASQESLSKRSKDSANCGQTTNMELKLRHLYEPLPGQLSEGTKARSLSNAAQFWNLEKFANWPIREAHILKSPGTCARLACGASEGATNISTDSADTLYVPCQVIGSLSKHKSKFALKLSPQWRHMHRFKSIVGITGALLLIRFWTGRSDVSQQCPGKCTGNIGVRMCVCVCVCVCDLKKKWIDMYMYRYPRHVYIYIYTYLYRYIHHSLLPALHKTSQMKIHQHETWKRWEQLRINGYLRKLQPP